MRVGARAGALPDRIAVRDRQQTLVEGEGSFELSHGGFTDRLDPRRKRRLAHTLLFSDFPVFRPGRLVRGRVPPRRCQPHSTLAERRPRGRTRRRSRPGPRRHRGRCRRTSLRGLDRRREGLDLRPRARHRAVRRAVLSRSSATSIDLLHTPATRAGTAIAWTDWSADARSRHRDRRRDACRRPEQAAASRGSRATACSQSRTRTGDGLPTCSAASTARAANSSPTREILDFGERGDRAASQLAVRTAQLFRGKRFPTSPTRVWPAYLLDGMVPCTDGLIRPNDDRPGHSDGDPRTDITIGPPVIMHDGVTSATRRPRLPRAMGNEGTTDDLARPEEPRRLVRRRRVRTCASWPPRTAPSCASTTGNGCSRSWPNRG